MMKHGVWTCVSGLVLVIVAAQPVAAVCPNARLITSIGEWTSYVLTPGVEGDGVMGSSVTADFWGSFWAVGSGDAAVGAGADNGDFPALEWLYVYPNYPATLNTAWSADSRIDGCVDLTSSTCTAIQLTDQNPMTGATVFALLSAQQDEFKNYYFDQAGGAPIQLAPMPLLQVTGLSVVGAAVRVDLNPIAPTAFDAGLYLDPSCAGPAGGGTGIELLFSGMALYYQVLPMGAPPPTDNRIDTGGWADSGVTVPFGEPAQMSFPCDTHAYIAYVLVNESGLRTVHTSGPGTRVECIGGYADPDERDRVKPPFATKPGVRKR